MTLVLVSLAQNLVGAQTSVRGLDSLAPPKSTLVPVHWPDLTGLENEVRDQIKSEQDSLAAVVRNSHSTEVELSAAYGLMGQTYHAYSLIAPARECYLNASRLTPKDFRWIYLLAKLDQQEGNVDEAIRRLQSVASLQPEFIAVPVNLGNINLELNRLEDAQANFLKALQIDKRSTAAYYGLGQVALSKRSYAEAVDYFQKALDLTPQANRIHYSLAMAYRGLGDQEKAKIHLAQQGPVGVRVADPLIDRLQDLLQGARVHLIRGRLAFEAKRYAEAATEFRQAASAKPDSVPAHVNLGAALTQIGDTKGAMEEFETTLRIDPNNITAHYNLAVLLAAENNHQQAIVHLQAVSSINPNDLDARFLLAQQLVKSTRLDEALHEFSRIAEADPDNEAALIERVKLLQWKKQHKDALDALEKAHARYPQKTQTLAMLINVLAASQQYELRDGARALKLAQLLYEATGSLQHGALVGLALAELGRCVEAADWQRKLIDAATKLRHDDLLPKLRADLQRYETVHPCRPSDLREP
ncbi:MAG TPA: tetratricopeptide repeat protein [Pyrinomonadaceae bacterium]|jgi:tetratricopeptide (TPR) repeat protein